MCQRKKWFTVWSTEAVVVLTLWRLWKHVNSLLKAICVFAFQMYAPMIDHFNNRQSNKAASCTFLAPLSCFHFHDARLKEITVISPNLTFKVWQVCILTVSLAYVYKYTHVCVCVSAVTKYIGVQILFEKTCTVWARLAGPWTPSSFLSPRCRSLRWRSSLSLTSA